MASPELKQIQAAAGVETGPRSEVERLIEKGRSKEAFKHAKACLHRQNSPENRRLVERTYLLRIEELVRGGMQTSAADVAKHFLDFGVSDTQILEGLVLILPRMGMASQAVALSSRLDSPQAQASLSLKVADEAVLHPAQSSAFTAEVQAGAQRIRAALAAIERSNEAEALDLLKDIPRNSPWADWRYFARGLAAFYRQDDGQAGENWDRLDPNRAAHCIAAVLKRTTPSAVNGGPTIQRSQPNKMADLSLLEVAVLGEPLLSRLNDLERHLGQNPTKKVDWQKACQTLAPLRLGLRRFDPRFAQRLSEILLEPLIEAALNLSFEQARTLVRDFTNAAEPLALDPQWNRLWALLWERPQGDPDGALNHWRKYLVDLEQLATLSPNERQRLQALVWRHIGELLADETCPEPAGFLAADPDRSATRRLLAPAVDALEQSLRLDPAQRPTYALLLALYDESDQPSAVAEVARRCLAAFPDDMEALRLLIEHHRRRDESEDMLRNVERARVIQPLEARLIGDEYWARCGLGRQLAVRGSFDEARSEFSRADELFPDQAHAYRMLVRRAALEYKAGQTDRAEELVRQARGKLDEPTALWLLLSIEAVRYDLPPRLRGQFQDAWQAALRKKTSSQTAGQVAEILLAYQMTGVEYSGLSQHVEDVVEYLGRTTRTKYCEVDLRNACLFLQQVSECEDLLGKLVKKGLKSFPRSAVFHCLATESEIKKGPYACDLSKAKKHAQAAVRLAEASTDPADQVLADHFKRQLLTLDDMAGAMSALPPFRSGEPRSGIEIDVQDVLQRMMGMMGNGADDADEDFSSDDESEFFFGGPRGRRPPARAPRKRK